MTRSSHRAGPSPLPGEAATGPGAGRLWPRTAGPPDVEMLLEGLKQVKDTPAGREVTEVFSLETGAWAPPTVHVLETGFLSGDIGAQTPPDLVSEVESWGNPK